MNYSEARQFDLPGTDPGTRAGLVETFDNLYELYGDPTKARSEAFRNLRRQGWYKTEQGWKQLGPNIRDKINIRKAVQQPDGRYLIRDVDVFYPNAVKGASDDRVFDPDRIDSIVRNTNRAIESGGQQPGISKEHPSEVSQAMGLPAASYGSGVNWRPSSRGKGWVRCDLIDVDPELVEDWKKGRYTGLSAGIVGDADGLNTRFGHIAVLGARSQALSGLPTTEIYHAGNQVCFSAEPQTFSGDRAMPNPNFGKLKQRFAALQAAFASAEAGEPDYEAKLNEALSAMPKEFRNSLASFMGDDDHEDEDEDKELIRKMMKDEDGSGGSDDDKQYMSGRRRRHRFEGDTGDDDDDDDDGTGDSEEDEYSTGEAADTGDSQGPHEKTRVPEAPGKGKTANETDPEDDTDVPVGKNEFAATINELKRERNTLKKVIGTMYAKQQREDFFNYAAELRDGGVMIPDDDKLQKMFSNCKGDPKQIENLRTMLQSMPTNPYHDNPSQVMFGSEGNKPSENAKPRTNRERNFEADFSEAVKKNLPGVKFTEQDFAIGEAMAQFDVDEFRFF